MPANELFRGLKKDTIRRSSSRSAKWLSNKIDKLADGSKTARPRGGDMFLYVYDAKYKNTLEYWDANPLIIMLSSAKGGWYGLNLHYLPPKLREVFLEQLLKADKNNVTERSKQAARSTILARAAKTRFFAPMIKRYLFSQIKSKFVRIPQDEWFNVAALPVARWKKASALKVYKNSRGKI